MTDTITPLTSAELADLKAKAKAAQNAPWGSISEARKRAEFDRAANPQTIMRLIDTTEKLRGALNGIDPSWYEDDSPENNAIREAIVATEPQK